MDVGIGIKVDPGDSVVKANAVEAALHKTEDRGKAAGQAMLGLAGNFRSLAAAIQQEQSAMQRLDVIHDRIARQNQPLAQGFAKIAEAIQREQQMLERIHGPAQRYEQDLQALDSLLARNVISTKEYAEQVANLNRQIEKTPAPKQAESGGGISGMMGEMAGPMAAAIAAPVMIKGGFEALAGFIDEQARLGDTYIEISNSAQRFTSSVMNVNAVLVEQGDLAKDLHSTLKPTMDLYDAVGDVTGDLNLSHRELIGLTRTLGEAALTEGQSLESAGAIMGRLSIAMQSGADGAGQLKKIFKDLPPLGEALAQAWNTDTAGVIRMVTSHEKGLMDIVDAWKRGVPEVHAKAAELQDTYAKTQEQFEERFKVQVAKGAGLFAAMLARQGKDFADYKLVVTNGMMEMQERGPHLSHIFGDVSQRIKDMGIEMARVAEVERSARVGAALQETLGEVPALLNQATYELQKFGDALGSLPQVRAIGIGQERAREVKAATDELKALTIAHDTDKKSVVDYANKKQHLLDIINGVTPAMHAEAAAAKKLTDEYKKLGQALLGTESRSARAIREGAADRSQSQAEIDFVGDLDHRTSFDAGAKRRAQIEQLGSMSLDPALYARGIDEINKAYNDTLGVTSLLEKSTDEYTVSMDKLRVAFGSGAISAAEFNAASYKLWSNSDQKKAADAADKAAAKAQDDIAKHAQEAAQRTRDAWVQGLGQISGQFVKMAVDGDLSFGKVLDLAAKFALQMSGGGFLSSFGGAALGGFASGGSFTVGNGNSPFELPRAANGANWTVGGTGSIDSKIAMFRVTPGESVHVRTPAQQGAAQGSQEMVGALMAAIERMQSPTVIFDNDPADSVRGYNGARMAERLRRRGAAR